VQDLKRLVGRYELLGQLGHGGMATVYLARQRDLDRLVALKELKTLTSSDPSVARRFLREARMAGSLSHPSIVTVHDYFEAEGTPFIAMEYMEQGSLRPYVGQMSLAQVGGVMEALLAGLDHAGRNGIVHRDLKPENVMVSSDGRVKIADFGIAKAANAFQTGGALTQDGVALGTPNYMSPEQALAEDVGTWTDIYAVGVMAFEIFVGRPPFADTPQPLVVIMRQVRDPIPAVTDLDPTIDPGIARWIAWLTAKDPKDRPQSAAQAWDAFEGILISILGPRWQRGARLPPLAAGAAVMPGPATPMPAGAPVGPLTQRSLAGLTTRPLDPDADPTLMPRANLLGIDRTEAGAAPAGTGAARGHRLRNVMLVLLLVCLLSAVALAAGGGRSQPVPSRAAHAPVARRKAASSSPAAPVAAAAAATAPASPAAAAATPASGSTLKAKAGPARQLARQYNAGAARIDHLSATGAQLDSNALIADLMRKTSSAYSAAATAASGGDAQGYAVALGAAQAAKGQVDAAVRAGAKASAAPAAPPASPCAGDSVSDDPSDDACNGGEP
jgi:hypothetical protein